MMRFTVRRLLAKGFAPANVDGAGFAAMLTGKGPPPKRNLFWHFPHYSKQGSRPSGAMRDENWMLVEFYDDDAVELYDLASDLKEMRNLAADQPERVAKMRAALAAWRKSVNAQSNRPNPDFDPARLRELYIDVDPGRCDPFKADPAEWQRMQTWRKGMNAVLQETKKGKAESDSK